MSEGIDALLSRASQELDAAGVLADNDFPRQAASRAYYGGFYAAEAALLLLGETRSKHSGVVSAFGRLVVKEGGLDTEIGRLLSDLFAERAEADYGEGTGRGGRRRDRGRRALRRRGAGVDRRSQVAT